MKLKRFTAPDIRQAMTKVRSELGADAVILSNRKTDEGIEIIAATDYDDAMIEPTQASTVSENRNIPVQKVIKARKYGQKKPIRENIPDALKTANTRKLAEQLTDSLDIKATSTTSNSRWKEALTEDQHEESSELRDLLDMEVANGSNGNVNQTQVSSDWINQFSSINQKPKNSKKPPASEPPKGNEDLNDVWNELSNLRGLLETQLSSLAWSDISKRHPVKSKTLKHLLELGLTPEVAYELVANIKENENFESCWRMCLATLAKRIPTIEDDLIKKGGIFALVGPTGVGKTTTIAKMAARYALTHGTSSIALVTTDNYRIGAQEQLRTYGRILGTPVKIANNATELRQVLKSLYDKELVLIDTAGTSQRDIRLTEQFSMLSEGSSLIKSYLVLSASSQEQVLSETVDAYKKVHLDGCVLTKLDEAITLGGSLSTIIQNRLPLAYISDGQRVPEDLHLAKSITLVKKSVSMMNNAEIKLDESTIEMAFGRLAADELS